MKQVLFLLAFILSIRGQGQNFKQHIAVLASDSLGGRPPGTAYEKKAADYIQTQLSSMRIATRTLPFDVRPGNDSTLHCRNVIGFINHRADSTIVFGAHYDHLGLGNSKSREIVKKGIHPGADDNASGVAMMLELARWISKQHSKTFKHYNFLFVGFSAHEIGLFGSSDFTQSPLFDSLRIKLFLNFDMVGRLDQTKPTVRLNYCTGHNEMRGLFDADLSSTIHINPDDDAGIVNDFTNFCNHSVSAVSLTTGLHDDYHKISDTEDKINYDGMRQIFELLRQKLKKLALDKRFN